MTTNSAGMDTRALRVSPILIAGVATALGIFSSFQAYNYVRLFTERPASFPTLMVLNMTFWYSWALLVPVMVWVARRYRFSRSAWLKPAAIHVAAVVAFVFLHAVFTVTLRGPILT